MRPRLAILSPPFFFPVALVVVEVLFFSYFFLWYSFFFSISLSLLLPSSKSPLDLSSILLYIHLEQSRRSVAVVLPTSVPILNIKLALQPLQFARSARSDTVQRRSAACFYLLLAGLEALVCDFSRNFADANFNCACRCCPILLSLARIFSLPTQQMDAEHDNSLNQE